MAAYIVVRCWSALELTDENTPGKSAAPSLQEDTSSNPS
jgi:hypothetical protein